MWPPDGFFWWYNTGFLELEFIHGHKQRSRYEWIVNKLSKLCSHKTIIRLTQKEFNSISNTFHQRQNNSLPWCNHVSKGGKVWEQESRVYKSRSLQPGMSEQFSENRTIIRYRCSLDRLDMGKWHTIATQVWSPTSSYGYDSSYVITRWQILTGLNVIKIKITLVKIVIICK